METKTEVTKKRTRHAIVHNPTWAMCHALPNVSCAGPNVASDSTYMGNDQLREALYNAAIEHPNWNFVVQNSSSVHIKDAATDSHLGRLALHYSTRAGKYIVELQAMRLPKTRQRSGSFTNAATAPILRMMREHVYPQTTEELFEKASNTMGGKMNALLYEVGNRKIDTTSKVRQAAMQYVMTAEVRASFVAAAISMGFFDIAKDVSQLDELSEEQLLLKDLTTNAGGKHPLVIQNKEEYIVKDNMAITCYAADELPEKYHGVYALKTANAAIPLAGVGIRTDEFSFIVITQD